MRNKVIILSVLLVVSLQQPAPGQSKSKDLREGMLVSTDWLAKHLNDESLVLLHVGEKEEYTAGHIPRAQFITTADLSMPRGEGLSLQMLPAIQLQAVLEKFGISNNSRVVVYFGKDWVTPTARVFFTLDYVGLGERTSILDGGLPAWRAEGRPVTTDVKMPKPGRLTTKPKPELIVDSTWVNHNSKKEGVKILDARAPQFYTGAEVGRMPRGGHIPGALNIPFSVLVEDANNKLKSPDALRQLFTTAGAPQGSTVATYCHIGQQASLLYFVARYLGYDAHLYDGSFEEWSRKAELPVEK
jgi:thiosulfate/3-mercaptopyruvate sulfurtransferase